MRGSGSRWWAQESKARKRQSCLSASCCLRSRSTAAGAGRAGSKAVVAPRPVQFRPIWGAVGRKWPGLQWKARVLRFGGAATRQNFAAQGMGHGRSHRFFFSNKKIYNIKKRHSTHPPFFFIKDRSSHR